MLSHRMVGREDKLWTGRCVWSVRVTGPEHSLSRRSINRSRTGSAACTDSHIACLNDSVSIDISVSQPLMEAEDKMVHSGMDAMAPAVYSWTAGLNQNHIIRAFPARPIFHTMQNCSLPASKLNYIWSRFCFSKCNCYIDRNVRDL